MGAPIRSGPYSGKPWTNFPELKAASARRRQAVLAPWPPRPCQRNSIKPLSFIFGCNLPVRNVLRWGKKAFVPVKGRRLKKHFAVPPVTCVPTYALPVTEETGRAYWTAGEVRPAAQEGSSDFRILPSGLHRPRIAGGFRGPYCLRHRFCGWLWNSIAIIRQGKKGCQAANPPVFGGFCRGFLSLTPGRPGRRRSKGRAGLQSRPSAPPWRPPAA